MRQVFEREVPAGAAAPEGASRRAPAVGTGGIVDPARARQAFGLERVLPAPDLADLVERHWVLAWDLPDGVSHTQLVVPHPAVNLVVEAEGIAVHGIPDGIFARTLVGRGVVVGTKFRPGGSRPLLGRSPGTLRGRSLRADAVLGPGLADDAAPALLGLARRDPGAAVRAVEAVLRDRVAGAPAAERERHRDRARLVDEVLAVVLATPPAALRRVDDLAAAVGTSVRGLQRLLDEYVGVSPTWVLRRHRVHEAAEALARDPRHDLTDLAVGLGWYDQAHLARDFTAALGVPPGAYARRCGAALEPAAST